MEKSSLGLDPAMSDEASIKNRYIEWLVFNSPTNIVPLGVREEVEWYILGMVEAGIPSDENLCPAGALGSYTTGVRVGLSALLWPTWLPTYRTLV